MDGADQLVLSVHQVRQARHGDLGSGVYAATMEERTDDIRAVMDAAESERAFVFGFSEGGCMACVFAATYPMRTRGLVLWATTPRARNGRGDGRAGSVR